jgi:hypothetical protein
MFKHANYGDAYFFRDEAFGKTSYTSKAFELGNLQQGIAVRAFLDEPAACTSGNTFTVAVEVSDTEEGSFTKVGEKTFTATGTAIPAGDLVSVPVDSTKAYFRVVVTASSGITGKFCVAEEYVAR